MHIEDNFITGIDPFWKKTQIGSGQVIRRQRALWLTLLPSNGAGIPQTQPDKPAYSDAQITDYDPQKRGFKLMPPLTLEVRAFSSHHPRQLVGTAGFGFWNHPYQPDQRGFRIPQALWFFFGAPPNRMPLALDVPGDGFKAATFDARRPAFFALLPLALPGFLLMRIPWLHRRLWPIGQRALGVTEAALSSDLLTDTHTYTLDWHADGARFAVDGETVMETATVPHGPLGFIAWMDNQYAVVTPQGQFGFGVSAVGPAQSLVLESIRLTSPD